MEEEAKAPQGEAGNISSIIGDGLSAINGSRMVEPKKESSPSPSRENTDFAVSSSTHEGQVLQQQQQELVPTKQESSHQQPLSSTLSVQSPVLLPSAQLVSDTTPSASSTPGQQQQQPPPQRPIPSLPPTIPTGKITSFCSKHPHVEVTLDGKELWDEFFRRGTEMIVNRAGR